MNLRTSLSMTLLATTACSSNGTNPTESDLGVATATASLETRSAPEGSIELEDGHRCGVPAGLAALPGFTISVWAKGTTDYFNPDSIEVDGDDIWVGYQNGTAPDGSDGGTSTIVEYTRKGRVERTFAIPGHCDGLRADPSTHLMYASSNEDANPALVTIDPVTGTVTHYAVASPTPHGGGLDDIGFVGGKTFIAGSNPTLNASGVNVSPALYQLTLSGTNAVLIPVLQGNATATDIGTGAAVTLNEIDPDSITIDPAGELVLDNQAGSELVFIANPGTATQSVRRLLLPTQVDDTSWATTKTGTLFVVDAIANTIYSVRASFVPGTVFTETPNDSSVPSMVGMLNLTTGFITPQIIGFQKPTGLLFVP